MAKKKRKKKRKKMNLVYPSENEIKTCYLWVSIPASHLHCQETFRSGEEHTCPFPVDAGRKVPPIALCLML